MKQMYFLYECSDRVTHMIPHLQFPILALPIGARSEFSGNQTVNPETKHVTVALTAAPLGAAVIPSSYTLIVLPQSATCIMKLVDVVD